MATDNPSGLTRWNITRYDEHGNDLIEPEPDRFGSWVRYSDVAALVERCRNLEAALKLCIGQHTNRPWYEVPDSDVDGYLRAALKEADANE